MKSVLVVFDCDVDEQWLAGERSLRAASVTDEQMLTDILGGAIQAAAEMRAGRAITFPYGGNFRVMEIRGVTKQ